MEPTPAEELVLSVYVDEWVRARDGGMYASTAYHALNATLPRVGLGIERVKEIVCRGRLYKYAAQRMT